MIRTLLAVVVLGAELGWPSLAPADAQDASTDGPVLWSGTLLDRSGHPTSGTVAAYVRPPTSVIPMISKAGSGTPPKVLEPVLVGAASAADDGRFEIRGVPPVDQIPPDWFGSDGSLDIMVNGSAENGEWGVGFDTVYFVDDPSVGQAWFSRVDAYEAARSEAAATSASARMAASSADRARAAAHLAERAELDRAATAAAHERPELLRMTFAAPNAARSDGVEAAWVPPPGPPYGGCGVQGVVASGQKTNRSIAETSLVAYWDVWSVFSNTNSTSWQIGASESGTSGWSFAGSRSFAQSYGFGVTNHFNSGPSTTYNRRVVVETLQSKVKWICSSKLGSCCPVTVYTIEATGWTGGSAVQVGSVVPCPGGWGGFLAGLEPLASARKEQGSSAAYRYNAGWFGFTLGQTTSYKTSNDISWQNQSTQFVRHLCGETDYPAFSHTRVSGWN